MTLLPLTPLDLPTFAALIRNGGEIACDWLMERFADLGVDPAGQQALGDVLLLYARDTVTCDVDSVPLVRVCDDCRFSESANAAWFLGKCPKCGGLYRLRKKYRLLDTHFTEALLARWLGMVGDGRAEKVGAFQIFRTLVDEPERESWVTGQAGRFVTVDHTEAAARLDLKRRVLGLFGEVERELKAGIPCVDIEAIGRGSNNIIDAQPLLIALGFRPDLTAERSLTAMRDDDNRRMVIRQTLHPIDFLPLQTHPLFRDIVDPLRRYNYSSEAAH